MITVALSENIVIFVACLQREDTFTFELEKVFLLSALENLVNLVIADNK